MTAARDQQDEFLLLWREQPDPPALGSLRPTVLSRRLSYRVGRQELAECEIELSSSRRRTEWGALWAVSIRASAQGGRIAETLAQMADDGLLSLDAGPALLAVDSRLDSTYMPPLRRDGTLSVTEVSDVPTVFASTVQALEQHVLPLLRRFVAADAGVIGDILARDGQGYRYPGASAIAAAVASGDAQLFEETVATKRFRKLTDVRGEQGRRIEHWARGRVSR